ncbi:MAG: PIN domain-containing protein [Bacteroidota bacterium]
MKQTKDNIFIDTNILVYTYSFSELPKQTIARKLIEQNISFISTQVIQELVNTITRKFKFTYTDAILAVNECSLNNRVHTNTYKTILSACDIAREYKFSFYDSMIIAAAIECNCSHLHSEDMHDGLVINNTLTIVNPFK